MSRYSAASPPVRTLAQARARAFVSLLLLAIICSITASSSYWSGRVVATAVAQEMAPTERQHPTTPLPENSTPYTPEANIIIDGSFEAGIPNPYWAEASTNFGTPLCNLSCGLGGGSGPHSGNYWAWFGGVAGTAETGSLEQSVVIPPGTATLTFWLEIPTANTSGFMRLSIDGNVLFNVTEAHAATYHTYQQVSINVSAYANGGAHLIRFDSTTNAGAGPLNFFVDDVRLDVPDVLYNNGPFINRLGSGAGGADESVLQTSSLGMTTYGLGVQTSSNNRLADDFTVTATGWRLDAVYFYAYQTGSTTTSSITGINLRIWNGLPGSVGASIVFGDTTTNRLLSSNWTQSYRVSDVTSGDTSRPVMSVVANLGGVILPAGTYWLDWQLSGSLASGPWAPPITITGQNITGNARQYVGSSSSWVIAEDNGSGTPAQGFPFVLIGNPIAPAHDAFAAARNIASLPYQHTDNTTYATQSPNDPIFPCGSQNRGNVSVWYRFTPAVTTNLVAYTHGSHYDTMLAVWVGSEGNLANVACSDDSFSPGYNLQSEVGFKAMAGTTYYLEVAAYGSSGPGGNLTFNLRQADKWTFSGPQRPSPSINELVIVSQSPNTVLAATTEGIFKSTDGGASWGARRNGLSTFGGLEVTGIVVDPTNAQKVYISTWGDGVYKSEDGGDNWILLEDPVLLQRSSLAALPPGIEPVRSGGTAMRPERFGHHWPADKTNWQEMTTPPHATESLSLAAPSTGETPLAPQPIDWTPARSLAIHPTNPNRLIVGVSGWGFYLSNNAGVSWSLLNMPGATLTSGRAIAFAPSNPNIAYASTGDWGANGGIFRSTDGGLTWNLVAGNATVTSVVTRFAIDPGNPNRVLIATYGQGILLTTNGGASWVSSSAGLGENYLYNLAISPANTNIVYATSDLWIWKSNNGGANWAIADTSYPDFYNTALALHPTDSNIAYVGSNQVLFEFNYSNSGIYKTTNGSSFTPRLNGLADTYVLDMVVDPNNASIIYAATWGSGIFRSLDGGITWAQANAGLWLPFVYALEATQGPLGTVLYAGTFYSNQAMFVSHNQGIGWTPLPDSLPTFAAQNVFDIASSDGSSVNLVIASGDGLYVTYDGGKTWVRGLLNGVNTTNITLSVERVPGIAGRMVAGTYGDGVYYSNNNGYDWLTASGENSLFIFGLSAAAGSAEVYAAHAGLSTGGQAAQGISRSTNGGVSWNLETSGLPVGVSFRSVDHSLGSNRHVYGGSIGQGVWVRPFGSDRWFRFSSGLTPTQVRKVQAGVSNPMRVFASTDGQGGWLFTPDKLPFFGRVYLPMIRR